jgi:TPR repeat protein
MVPTHPSQSCASASRRLRALPILAVLGILGAHAQQRGLAVDPSVSEVPGASNGKYYALVIGIDQYPAPMPQLRTAVDDSEAIAKDLTNLYGFQVTLLLDGQATRANILNAIVKYRTILSENDSLLIYYGGHGYYDRDADKAYWLPVDADSSFSANRIIADDLTSDLKGLPARHVLIISDSCYSGGLSREANEIPSFPSTPSYLNRLLRTRSRSLMSSGGIEPVADDGPGGHSVFASAILKGLERQDNEPQFAAMEFFFTWVHRQVAGNSRQIPEYLPLRDSSDDGGDFVFTRKDAIATVARSTVASPRATWDASTPVAATPPGPVLSQLGSASVFAPGSSSISPVPAPATMTSAASSRDAALGKRNQFAQALPLLVAPHCSIVNSTGCDIPGAMREFGGRVVSEPAEAVALFRETCNTGSEPGCVLLAMAYADGYGVGRDTVQSQDIFRKAAVLARKGCDAGDFLGCESLGVIYADGSGVGRNVDRAATLFRKACDGGEPVGCESLVRFYPYGGPQQDEVQAVSVFSKACDGGEDPTSCVYLGVKFENGSGVEKDATRAVALYTKACDGGDAMGCSRLGDMYEGGNGVDKDEARALALYTRSCDAGEPIGCLSLGSMYENGHGVALDNQRAAALYRQACNSGLDWGCKNLKRVQP